MSKKALCVSLLTVMLASAQPALGQGGLGGGGGLFSGGSGLLVGGAIIGVTAGIIIAVTAEGEGEGNFTTQEDSTAAQLLAAYLKNSDTNPDNNVTDTSGLTPEQANDFVKNADPAALLKAITHLSTQFAAKTGMKPSDAKNIAAQLAAVSTALNPNVNADQKAAAANAATGISGVSATSITSAINTQTTSTTNAAGVTTLNLGNLGAAVSGSGGGGAAILYNG